MSRVMFPEVGLHRTLIPEEVQDDLRKTSVETRIIEALVAKSISPSSENNWFGACILSNKSWTPHFSRSGISNVDVQLFCENLLTANVPASSLETIINTSTVDGLFSAVDGTMQLVQLKLTPEEHYTQLLKSLEWNEREILSVLYASGDLYPFPNNLDRKHGVIQDPESRESVFEERNRVLDAIDECEEARVEPELLAKLQYLNERIDAFRIEDFEKSKNDFQLTSSKLDSTNDQLLVVFNEIMARLNQQDGDNRATTQPS